jgi:hypothetical protein
MRTIFVKAQHEVKLIVGLTEFCPAVVYRHLT